MIAKTPSTPYYAVIFTSTKQSDSKEYDQMAQLMVEVSSKQKGFLGIESARNHIGITISYWTDLDAIKAWKSNMDHRVAQEKGRKEWYSAYKVRISKVERDYGFNV